MSGTTIGFDCTTPAVGDFASLGPSVIQSFKTSVVSALDAEHGFPASGGLAGYHRAGSARAFVGLSSQISSADTAGRMMAAGQKLYYVGSDGTWPIGGRTVPYIESGSLAASITSGHRFASSVTTGSTSTFLVAAFFGVVFDAVPVVMASFYTSASGTGQVVAIPCKVTTSACSVALYDVVNAQYASAAVCIGTVNVVATGTVSD